MLLGGFPEGTEYDEVLYFVESRCKGIHAHVTLVYMREDAHGYDTGVAEVHFGQRVWPAFVERLHQQKFLGHEILVLPSEQCVSNGASLSPPRARQELVLAMGVPPPSEDADMVPVHMSATAEEHSLLRYDVAGETTLQLPLIPQPDWWPFNNPRNLLQLPAITQLRSEQPDGWDSWDEMRADVIVRSRLLEESHAELLLRLRQIEIDTAILRANGDTSILPQAIPSTHRN